MIKLKHGETFCNKSYIYLFPLFKSFYGLQLSPTFKSKIKLAAIGIKDYLQPSLNNHIFLCVDVATTGNKNMEILLADIQDLSFYETDYAIYDNYHMLVFKTEDKMLECINKFKESKYSEMINTVSPKILYSDQEVIDILLKTPAGKKRFVDLIKSKYGVSDETIDEMKFDEYDFKIDESENFNSQFK